MNSFFIICIDIFSKYGWVISLKGKKDITITKAFQKILVESRRRPKKMWVDKDSEFYKRSKKTWLQNKHKEMYLTRNEGKSVVAERFIKILKNKI